MGYESKKKKRKQWRDLSTVERAARVGNVDSIKVSGQGCSYPPGWPTNDRNLPPTPWDDVVSAVKAIKRKVFQ